MTQGDRGRMPKGRGTEAALRLLGLEGAEPGRDHRTTCPLHKGRSDAFSVHPAKGVYQCFSCGASGRLEDLPSLVPDDREEVTLDEVGLSDIVSPVQVRQAAKTFISQRRLVAVKGLTADVEKGSRTYGYLEIPDSLGRVVARRRLFPGDPRYLYERGSNGGVCCVQPPLKTPGTPVWLCEGALDGHALRLAGAKGGIYALGGKELPDDLAYALQEHHVLICLDNDVAGYISTKKARKVLQDVDVPCTAVRIRGRKDPGQWWAEDPKGLESLVRRNEERIAPDERAYVRSLIEGKDKLLVVPTHLPALDKVLEGGYTPGLHVLLGMTTVGKSSWALWVAWHAAQAGLPVLYVTTELPKRQVWARLASIYPKAPSWTLLDKRFGGLSKAQQEQLGNEMASRVRVVGNRGPRQIEQDVRAMGARLVVVDYLQRLTGTVQEGEGVTASSLGAVTGALGDIAQEHEVAVLAISSINRASYGEGGGMGSPKGSGDIEFFSQSLVSMVRAPSSDRAVFRVEKNTRGEIGAEVAASYDPLHCRFGEAR